MEQTKEVIDTTNWYISIYDYKDGYGVIHRTKELKGPYKTLDQARKMVIAFFDLYMLKEGYADISMSRTGCFGRMKINIKSGNFTPFVYCHGNKKWTVNKDGSLGKKIR